MSSAPGIYFTINILLAFSLKKKEEKTGQNKNTAKKKTKQEPEDPPYLLRLAKTCSTAHIEYELLPGKGKACQVDVLCWPNAAKIYFSDRTKIFKTITNRGLTFVPICIEHQFKELSINDLIALRNAVIEFNIYTDKNKLGNPAKSNKTECVYLRQLELGSTGFVEGFTENPNISVMKRSTQLINVTDVRSQSVASQKNEPFVQLKFAENFEDRFLNIINSILSDNTIPRNQILCRDFIKPCNNPGLSKSPEDAKSNVPKLPSSGKASEKQSQKSKPVTGKLTLQMQGEIFFTDADNATFRLEDSKSEIRHIFVMPCVENLLTRLQKLQLNAIVIKVKSIQNFPHELFENTGFTSVYCKYSIPYIAECKTIEKPIEETIMFMEPHIFPTHTLPKIKLLEFLETKRFVIELYGVHKYQYTETTVPKLFGEKPEDTNISKVHVAFRKNCLEGVESLETKDILLAYCSYDLSSLLKNVWDFRAEEQLHTAEGRILFSNSFPQFKMDPKDNENACEFMSYYGLSLNQINLAGISFDTNNISPLKEYILMQNNTVLDLEAYLLSPQSASLVLHQIPNTYKRLLMIAFNLETALQCFSKILKHNELIICKKSKDEDVLSGFLLDNGNNFIIYTEGHSTGYILNLFQDCDSILPEKAKIFFNTDQAYEKRLYNVCNKWYGFFLINLRIPLEHIFKNEKIYVKGNMPILCQKALIKLNLLLLCSTMKSMFQYDLFPTIEELLSLDIEYGVPFAWKQFTESTTNVATDEESLRQG